MTSAIIVVVTNMAVGTAVRLQSLDHHVNCTPLNYTISSSVYQNFIGG